MDRETGCENKTEGMDTKDTQWWLGRVRTQDEGLHHHQSADFKKYGHCRRSYIMFFFSKNKE